MLTILELVDALNDCIFKVCKWKDEIERKGLQFKMRKTKILISGI